MSLNNPFPFCLVPHYLAVEGSVVYFEKALFPLLPLPLWSVTLSIVTKTTPDGAFLFRLLSFRFGTDHLLSAPSHLNISLLFHPASPPSYCGHRQTFSPPKCHFSRSFLFPKIKLLLTLSPPPPVATAFIQPKERKPCPSISFCLSLSLSLASTDAFFGKKSFSSLHGRPPLEAIFAVRPPSSFLIQRTRRSPQAGCGGAEGRSDEEEEGTFKDGRLGWREEHRRMYVGAKSWVADGGKTKEKEATLKNHRGLSLSRWDGHHKPGRKERCSVCV